MKNSTRLALALLVGTAGMTSMGAHAAHLTPQECSEYPFTHAKSVTHAQLEDEVALLDKEGYDSGSTNENDYPNDILSAEDRLQHDYARDCLHNGLRSAKATQTQ